MIKKEGNFQRKSHRINLLLKVEINGKTYSSDNWSTSGVGVRDFKETLQSGEIVPANLIFPMVGSTLCLSVNLRLKSNRDNVTGFEFNELSLRNKRVLRHYIELAVNGQLDNLEDLIAISAPHSGSSPIDDALNLSDVDVESESHIKNFKNKSYWAIFLGILFVLIIAALVFYNTIYKVEATGLVAGNLERVTANNAGVISAIDIKIGMYVDKNTPLFGVKDTHLETDVKVLEKRINQLISSTSVIIGSMSDDVALINSMKIVLKQSKAELSNAKHLYKQRVISNKDLLLVRNHYEQVHTNLLKEMVVSTNNSQIIRDKFALENMKAELLTKKLLLEHQAISYVVRAQHKGKVFQINKVVGAYVLATDPVILLETDTCPHVFVRLSNDDVLKLHIGMRVDVYVPFEKQKYQAMISAIGLNAANAETNIAMETTLNDTLVRVDFVDQHVRLPSNSRVKVWITIIGVN
ncbi:MAG: HlyD family efflux transporter periplasmic adaptor subunit [Gallionella sp.]